METAFKLKFSYARPLPETSDSNAGGQLQALIITRIDQLQPLPKR